LFTPKILQDTFGIFAKREAVVGKVIASEAAVGTATDAAAGALADEEAAGRNTLRAASKGGGGVAAGAAKEDENEPL
jgi:hypothetical protein